MMTQQRSSSTFIRVSPHDPCQAPGCGRIRGCTYTIRSGKRYSICVHNKDAPKIAKDGRGIFTTDAGDYQTPVKPRQPIVATIQRRHAVYTALLERLTLEISDREHLLQRGISAADLEIFKYKSTADIASKLDSAGHILDRVPGFYKEKNEWKMNISVGFFIPIRDSTGRIQALQIRTYGTPKYKWFSSYLDPVTHELMEGGASSGAPVHFAKIQLQLNSEQPLWITEAPLKADVFAAKTHLPVIGTAGVNAGWVAAADATMNYGKVILAFDMDWDTNIGVQHAMNKLRAEILRRHNIPIDIAMWSSTFKGIDDYLLAGNSQIKMIPFTDSIMREVVSANIS